MVSFIDKHRADCSVREERAADPGWRCVPASRFRGSCISSAELADVLASGGLHRCLELDVDAEFCEDETAPFDVTVYLTTSDVELDCNDRTITGMPGGPGLRTPYEHSVSAIRIRSCHIQDTERYGIDLKRYFRGAELDGEMQGHHDISVADTSDHSWGRRWRDQGFALDRPGSFFGYSVHRYAVGVLAVDASSLAAAETHGSLPGSDTQERGIEPDADVKALELYRNAMALSLSFSERAAPRPCTIIEK